MRDRDIGRKKEARAQETYICISTQQTMNTYIRISTQQTTEIGFFFYSNKFIIKLRGKQFQTIFHSTIFHVFIEETLYCRLFFVVICLTANYPKRASKQSCWNTEGSGSLWPFLKSCDIVAFSKETKPILKDVWRDNKHNFNSSVSLVCTCLYKVWWMCG